MEISHPTPRSIGRTTTHIIRATIKPIMQPTTFANPLIMRYWWEVWWASLRPKFLCCFVAVISVGTFFNHASNDGVAVWVARRLNDVWRQKRNVQAGRNKYYLRRSVEIFPWLNEHSLAIRLIRRATYTCPSVIVMLWLKTVPPIWQPETTYRPGNRQCCRWFWTLWKRMIEKLIMAQSNPDKA